MAVKTRTKIILYSERAVFGIDNILEQYRKIQEIAEGQHQAFNINLPAVFDMLLAVQERLIAFHEVIKSS